MEDAGFEYLDLDAELQAALPKDGKDYLKQFGGLQTPDLASALSGTYYEGVPLEENPEAIFDVLSRESQWNKDHRSFVKESRESKTGSALITPVTSLEEESNSKQNSARVIGRADKRYHSPSKRVSFNDGPAGKENEASEQRKPQEKKSRLFPHRNEGNEKSPQKDKALHAPQREEVKGQKRGKGLRFSGFSKLLHKKAEDKFQHSTPKADQQRFQESHKSQLRCNPETNHYNTIGDIDFESEAIELDDLHQDISFDVNEVDVCYGSSKFQNGDLVTSTSSSESRRTVPRFSERIEDRNSSKSSSSTSQSNVSLVSSVTSHTLLTVPSEVSGVVEILSTEPSHNDVINRKRHLEISSNILKLQEPLPSAALGKVEKLRMFVDSLSRDTILRTVDENDQSALHLAVLHGHLDCVVLLCSKFPEMLQSESKDKLTPSSLAIKAGKIEILDWLIEHTSVSKEFSSTKQRRSLVHQAAKFGQDGCLRLLLDKLQSRGSVREPLDFASNTPAHLAAKYGHLTCLQTLVEYGRDVCIKNQSDVTPFQFAQAANHRHCAAYLVAIHSNRQLAQKLAFKSALIKRYEDDRRRLKTEHNELLNMTRDFKATSAQTTDYHGNLSEILDHVVTQMEDLYIENSALRQRFNGAKKGSFVLRDDVKAMLSKLKMLRQDLESPQEAPISSTSAAWQRLQELQRHTDDVSINSLPSPDEIDNVAWRFQRDSLSEVYKEMYHPHSRKETQPKPSEASSEESLGNLSQMELYVSSESLSNRQSFKSERKKRLNATHTKDNDPQNDINSARFSSRGSSKGLDLIERNGSQIATDLKDHTYDELYNMRSYHPHYKGVRQDGQGAIDRYGYQEPHDASYDANVIEIVEPASESSIDLPNDSIGYLEDDIDAMDSVSQVGDDNRDPHIQYSRPNSFPTGPDITADAFQGNTFPGSTFPGNTFPGSFSGRDNHLDRKSDGAKNRTGVVNGESLKSSLAHSSSARHTKELTFTKDESSKQGFGDSTNDGSLRTVSRSVFSGAKMDRAFEQSENIPRKHDHQRDALRGVEEIGRAVDGDRVGFTAVLCGTDKEHISKGQEMLSSEEMEPEHTVSGLATLSPGRSSLDPGVDRSSLLRDIEQESEDILTALGSELLEDIEPSLPSDGAMRIPPSMQFEMRLTTIEEASIISGSIAGDDDDEDEEEDVESDEDADDEHEDGNSPMPVSSANQLEDSSVNMAATEFSGDEKPWYENSDEDDVTTWRPRARDQHGLEEHLTLL